MALGFGGCTRRAPSSYSTIVDAVRLLQRVVGRVAITCDCERVLEARHGPLPASYMERWGPGGPLFRPEPGVPLAEAAKTKQPFQIADNVQPSSILTEIRSPYLPLTRLQCLQSSLSR